jgi:hypothetical protein
MNDEEALIQAVRAIAAQMQGLHAAAVAQYTPVVQNLIVSGSRNRRHIEQALDGLLDFCDHEPALQLYRRLCRHYFAIDPVATADYVNAYRERWDSAAADDEG